MEDWVPPPPHTGRHDYRRRIAAWVCRLVPPELVRACPSLSTHPLGAGRIAWAVARATLLARGREEDVPLAMSAVISAERLRGALTEQDIALVRAVQLPLDTVSSAEVLRQRMDALAAVGGDLPVHMAADVPQQE